MLIPTPMRVERLGAWVEDPRLARGDWPTARIEPGLGAEAYKMTIAPDAAILSARIEVSAGDVAGARHARATLAQLRRRFGARWPALRITDRPGFAVRGVMLDVSRDRIPTMDEFGRIFALLGALKFNHVQMYTEHTFAYAGHEEVWEGWSPITPGEARQLDVLARSHGLTLAANQNCFGHLASWLRRPRYAHLAETHGDWVFDVWPRSGPFSLCPVDPGSLSLVEDLLGQLLPCFAGGLVNIGCDETYDVGFGRSKGEVTLRGRAAVYAEFVAKVAKAALARGARPMFWADIAISHPEALAMLPEELIALAWGYEPDAPFGRWCDQVRAAGGAHGTSREVWVCPGTSTWRSITGRTAERRGNIESAARDGIAHGAAGFLVCDWGDTGHHQQWPVVAHALAHAAQAAWNPGAASAFDPAAAAMHAVCPSHDPWDPAGGFDPATVGRWLEELGDADLPLRETCLALSRPGVQGRLRNQSALFIDLHNWRGVAGAEVGALREWEAARSRVERLAAAVSSPRGLPALVEAELRHTAEVASLAADRAVLRRAAGGLAPDPARALAERARAIEAEHRRLWALRSRPGGLENSCRHYRAVIADLESPARA